MSNRGFHFPSVMEIGEESKKIILPRDVYIKYIREKISSDERNILLKWQQSQQLTDDEYRLLIKNSFSKNNEMLPEITNEGIDGLIEKFGIKISDIDDDLEFELIDAWLPKVKSDTYQYLIIDIFEPLYKEILEKLFEENDIYLGAWKNKAEEDLQSLDTSIRNAFLFTLFDFIYGDNRDDYEYFESFFKNEFEKRATLVKNIWNTREVGKPIKYLPIYDSFRNYDKNDCDYVKDVVKNILKSEDITFDAKNDIENRLINQAKNAVKFHDGDAMDLKNDILQPLVAKIVNIHKAEAFLNTAKINYTNSEYDSAINRCYYSMLRGVRSILAQYNILSDWKFETLSPDETHWTIEKDFKNEIIFKRHLLNRRFLTGFKYVKEQRWLADYSDLYLDKKICNNCISEAELFLTEIKKYVEF